MRSFSIFLAHSSPQVRANQRHYQLQRIYNFIMTYILVVVLEVENWNKDSLGHSNNAFHSPVFFTPMLYSDRTFKCENYVRS